jgi:plastocyanin
LLPGFIPQAPSRRLVRAGACAVLVLLAGCDRVGLPGADTGPRVIELAHDTVRLQADERLVEVRVRRDAAGDFEPAHVQASPGDYVRFTAGDGAGHAIVFIADELPAAARAFLERTGQVHSAPLIREGASWVITLEDAPTGDYPFHCATHDSRGRLSVTAR